MATDRARGRLGGAALRWVAIGAAAALIAAACADDTSTAGAGEQSSDNGSSSSSSSSSAEPASSDDGEGSPASGEDPPESEDPPAPGPELSESGDPMTGQETAASLTHENTGITGAVAAGLFDGTVDDPYANLRVVNDGLTITEDWIRNENGGNRVVEGLDIRGRLLIEAPGVTVRYCRITGDNLYLVDNRRNGDGSDFTLEWCELVNERVEGSKTVYGSGMRLYRVEIIGGDDGVVVSTKHDPIPTVIEEVYSHSLRKGPGAHADNIQLAPGIQASVTIARSRLMNFAKSSNAPVFVEDAHDVTVTENYLYGGVYHVMASSDDGGTLRVIGNAMAYDTFNAGLWSLRGDNEIIEENVWWDHDELANGTPVEAG